MAASGITPTERIRNVVLVGHGGSGKTTLAEALLSVGGVGDERGGVLDFEPEERERGCSLGLALASLPWRDHRLNLLDAPGSLDAVGDAYPALSAADVAVFVVDGTVGVQPVHDQLWEACASIGLPRIVFVNKLDRESAEAQAVIDELRGRYGKPVAPVHLPMSDGERFSGVIDLLHRTAVQRIGGERTIGAIPEALTDAAEVNREYLVEAIVEHDDDLLERYLEGETPEPDELGACFALGIAEESFFPVLCGSAAEQIGVRLLADFIVDECPPPQAADGSPATYVAKTLSDPYVGRISMLRILSGGLEPDATLNVQRTGASVRLHQLFRLTGKHQEAAGAVAAGDIVAVSKLEDVRTRDVLAAKGAEVKIAEAAAPEPFHRVALAPESAGDEEKLSTALARISEEDPSLRVERDADTGQLLLRAYSPVHVAVALARVQRKFGVGIRQLPPRIAYRETLRGKGSATGKHVKQTGGAGQYGIAHVEIEPLPRGGGFEFHDRIVGGVIPRQFIPAVEKGVREAMDQGVLAGYPVVDVAVYLTDGKHHSVDSSEMAFQHAGWLAFRAAAEEAGLQLLEPIVEVEVTVPDELTGDVMGDLSSRRGRIQGTEPIGGGHTTVRAQVPEAELRSYTGDLRSLTSGAGTVTMRYDHRAEVPEQVAQRVVEQAASAAS